MYYTNYALPSSPSTVVNICVIINCVSKSLVQIIYISIAVWFFISSGSCRMAVLTAVLCKLILAMIILHSSYADSSDAEEKQYVSVRGIGLRTELFVSNNWRIKRLFLHKHSYSPPFVCYFLPLNMCGLMDERKRGAEEMYKSVHVFLEAHILYVLHVCLMQMVSTNIFIYLRVCIYSYCLPICLLCSSSQVPGFDDEVIRHVDLTEHQSGNE